MKNYSNRLLSKIVSAIVIFTFLFSVISPTRAQAAPPPPVKPSQAVPGTPTPSVQPQAGPAVTPVPPDVDSPQFEEARARAAMQSALDKYLEYLGPRYQTGEIELSIDGGWALGTAPWTSDEKTFDGRLNILAQRQQDGSWMAMLPDGSEEFAKMVEVAPKELISIEEKEEIDLQVIALNMGQERINSDNGHLSLENITPMYPIATSFRLPLDGAWNPSLDFGDYNDAFPGKKHLGEDVIKGAGTPVYAAAIGEVRDNTIHTKYGSVVVIEHTLSDGQILCTVYGHLKQEGIIPKFSIVAKGQLIGYLGTTSENGGYTPHIHFGVRNGAYTSWVYYGYDPGGQFQYWHDPTDFINSHSTSSCSAPSLSSPNNDYVSPGSTITFSWSHANNCSGQNGFFVRVGTSSGGNDVKNDEFIPGLQGNINFDSQWYNRDLYWSVRANANGAAWSESRHFRIEPPPASCSNNANQAVFWTGVNFSGQCITRDIGNYPNPASIGLPNDSISSIQVGSDVKVTLCGIISINRGNRKKTEAY